MNASPLGRGLGSLIPDQKTAAGRPLQQEPQGPIQRLPITAIAANPNQPRGAISHESIEELVRSIREHGILQPLVVTPKNGGYELIAGERRYRAATIVGLQTIPVVVREASQQEQLELGLVENLQRTDLNPLEEANAYQRLVDEFNMTQEQIARRVGKSRSYVANTLRLRALPAEVKQAILGGKISEGHAKVLLSFEAANDQLAFLRKILEQGLSVRESEAVVHARRGTAKLKRGSADPVIQGHEETLQRALGTKVSIRRAGKGGKIIIEFYSREELASLLQQLTTMD